MLYEIPYYIVLVAIYAVYFLTFLLAGGQKVLDKKVPDWFTAQFGKTLLAKFPGIAPAYWTIAFLELLVPLLIVVSLVQREFLTGGEMLFLQTAVSVASLIFAILGFGQRLVQDFPGAANSFFYFAGTLVTQMFLVKVLS